MSMFRAQRGALLGNALIARRTTGLPDLAQRHNNSAGEMKSRLSCGATPITDRAQNPHFAELRKKKL
ncbi:hypothetical protein [Nonomuraea insulae]|uniref:Uncharacterized protein n=1 Tax=Nonomuraea insulae TaxID=1616787 RepID=A0ABW1CFY8_9ACTN